jgi:hypothetical protein
MASHHPKQRSGPWRQRLLSRTAALAGISRNGRRADDKMRCHSHTFSLVRRLPKLNRDRRYLRSCPGIILSEAAVAPL